jgi:hypothetical protein
MRAEDIQETLRKLFIDVYLLGITKKNKGEFEEMFMGVWMTIFDLKDEIKKL